MVRAYRPGNLFEALEIRGEHDTVVLAGGTDLMVKNRVWSGVIPRFSKPVIFVGHLQELRKLYLESGVLHIGAATTLSDLLEDPLVPEYVKKPVAQMASPSVRSLATLGGNICNSSPAGDALPMLYALDASITIQSKESVRKIPISDFITGPGAHVLKNNEIVTGIQIPVQGFDHIYYKKVGARKANAISKASFFAVSKRQGSRILEVRMAMGAVAPTPVRSLSGEALLKDQDQKRIPMLVESVTSHYSSLIRPIDDTRSTGRYRHKVAMLILEHYLMKELAIDPSLHN